MGHRLDSLKIVGWVVIVIVADSTLGNSGKVGVPIDNVIRCRLPLLTCPAVWSRYLLDAEAPGRSQPQGGLHAGSACLPQRGNLLIAQGKFRAAECRPGYRFPKRSTALKGRHMDSGGRCREASRRQIADDCLAGCLFCKEKRSSETRHVPSYAGRVMLSQNTASRP